MIEDDLAGCIEKGDVVIDFTSHEASAAHLEIAAAKGRAIVIGSTGFTPEELKRAGDAGGRGPVRPGAQHECRRQLSFSRCWPMSPESSVMSTMSRSSRPTIT